MRGNPRLHLARAALAALLATAGGCHAVLGPAPLEEKWRMHPGPRVTFFVRPDSFAEQNVARLSEVVEDQYSSTVRALGLSYAGHVSAYAYNSGAEADFGSDHAGRAYPETESFRFVAVPPADGNLFHLMSHEANHVFVINGLGRAGTYGMNEGLASALVSETFHTSGRHFLFTWTRTQRAQVLPLARVYDNDAWKDLTAQAAYNTSASFLAWLLDTYGADRLRQIYGAPSREFADRVRAVYGRPLESLEADWLRFCDVWVG
jgi:hypothetical protein